MIFSISGHQGSDDSNYTNYVIPLYENNEPFQDVYDGNSELIFYFNDGNYLSFNINKDPDSSSESTSSTTNNSSTSSVESTSSNQSSINNKPENSEVVSSKLTQNPDKSISSHTNNNKVSNPYTGK